MDIQSSLLETAQELYNALLRIHPEWSLRTKYGVLGEVLHVAVDQQLRDVTLKFSGLYSKIDYLVKLHNGRKHDLGLSHALNEARHHLTDLSVLSEEELEAFWPHDLKAVSRFVELLYGEQVPMALAALFPTTAYRQPIRSEGNPLPEHFRCIVTHWDDSLISATREDTDEEVSIDYAHPLPYVPGDRSYLKGLLRQDMVLSIVRPRMDEEGRHVLPELVIIDPDYLVNVTSVAHCFEAPSLTPLTELIRRITPFEQTQHTLMGNFCGQLLDEVAHGNEVTYADSIREFFRRNALAFLSCPGIGPDFHTQAQQQKRNIRHMLQDVYAAQTNRDFNLDKVILEPSFICPLLGLQGRMDLLNLDFTTVFEQKAGKCEWNPQAPADRYGGKKTSHYVQLLLYRALLHYAYARVPYTQMESALLYSRYADGLDLLGSAPKLLFEAFKLRNQLAWCETFFAEGGMCCLERLTPERIYPQAQGALWERFQKPQLQSVLVPIQHASELERAYFFRFMKFVANEQALSKLGNRTKENAGFAATWNASLTDKREAGNIYEALHLVPTIETDGTVSDVVLQFNRSNEQPDADRSNFRMGDIVFFYAYRRESIPDATHTMVFRASITDILPEGIHLRLRNVQSSREVFDYFNHADLLWAVEHDFMESSFSGLYRGLQSFLTAPQDRRDLLLGQRRPEVDHSLHRMDDYGSDEFNSLVEHVRQASDLYLLIGPPGTGKTSFGLVNILHDTLLQPDSCILLLSYTNRAVDEICSKLVEMEQGRLDFIRLGSDFSCDERYRPYLLSERMKQVANMDEAREVINRVRIVCGTTTALNANIAMLQLKHFDLAIVDEASQILEPHIIGLLSAAQGAACAIGKFVLIGDEKQLPAVVQQGIDESTVDDASLRSIGLTDCRLSLFERLLHLHAYLPDGGLNPEVCHLLTHQGRMHRDIADFPNRQFYGGRLTEVPLQHQIEHTPESHDHGDWMERMLCTRRVAFVDCRPSDNPDEPDKVNRQEALLVARLVKHVYDMGSDGFSATHSVGVIVPYRNQISAIRQAIDAYHIPVLHDISIDTVERYQGSQRDVIIYSFTAKKKYQLSFLTNNEYVDPRDGAVIDRKLNVAMTRARKHLILVGHAPLLRHDITFGRLIDYAKANQAFYEEREE